MNIDDSIDNHILNPLTRDGLRKYGIWVGEDYLRFANNHTELGKILKNTKWSINWNKTLARFEKAEKVNTGNFNGHYSKSVQIPYKFT